MQKPCNKVAGSRRLTNHMLQTNLETLVYKTRTKYDEYVQQRQSVPVHPLIYFRTYIPDPPTNSTRYI